MKFNVLIKKAEISSIKDLMETINNIIPEELGFEMPSAEDLRLENGRYFDEEKYGYLLVEEDHGDYEVTMDLKEEFTTDTFRLVNKITLAAGPIVGAVIGFAGTMKVLGGKFIKKLTDLGEKFSEKWFISPEPAPENKNVEEEMKYGVYPLVFNWTDTTGIEHWERDAVVVGRQDDGGYDIVKSRGEIHKDTGWTSALKAAEAELIAEIKAEGFTHGFKNLDDAEFAMNYMYEDMQPEKPKGKIETPIGDTFRSLENLEKTIREKRRNSGEE